MYEIALEINGERYETTNSMSLVWAIEAILREAQFIVEGESLEVLSRDQRWILSKAEC